VRSRTFRQPICVERAVSVSAQLSFYMIPLLGAFKKKIDQWTIK